MPEPYYVIPVLSLQLVREHLQTYLRMLGGVGGVGYPPFSEALAG